MVERKRVLRVLIMNFISSLIIAIVTCDILHSFGLKGGMYLGNLFGLYFLVVYGVNNIADAREIPNTVFKFILILAYILLFDAVYLFLIPFLFGPNAFPATELMAVNYGGVPFSIALSKEFYLALFAVIMLIFNYLIYRNDKRYFGE